jgi:hypothetical protein
MSGSTAPFPCKAEEVCHQKHVDIRSMGPAMVYTLTSRPSFDTVGDWFSRPALTFPFSEGGSSSDMGGCVPSIDPLDQSILVPHGLGLCRAKSCLSALTRLVMPWRLNHGFKIL